MAGPHLRPLKAQMGRKAPLHCPQRTGDQPQHSVPDEDEDEEDDDPSAGAVWTPAEEFKKN